MYCKHTSHDNKTKHLFILVINQLDAQNFFYIKFIVSEMILAAV